MSEEALRWSGEYADHEFPVAELSNETATWLQAYVRTDESGEMLELDSGQVGRLCRAFGDGNFFVFQAWQQVVLVPEPVCAAIRRFCADRWPSLVVLSPGQVSPEYTAVPIYRMYVDEHRLDGEPGERLQCRGPY